MHSNGVEGSHKNPAEEIWAFDLNSKTLVGRAPSVPAIAVTVSQGQTPAVFAVDGLKAEIVRYELPAAGAAFALTPAATDKTKLLGFHWPYPGVGHAERKDSAYQYVAAM